MKLRRVLAACCLVLPAVAEQQERKLGWQTVGTSCKEIPPTLPPTAAFTPTNNQQFVLDEDRTDGVVVVGATHAGTTYYYRSVPHAVVTVPSNTTDRDILVLFVGGSDQMTGASDGAWLNQTLRFGDEDYGGWKPIIKAGSGDLNIIALWTEYIAAEFCNQTNAECGDEASANSFTIKRKGTGVKNTWSTMIALRNLNTDRPIKASDYVKTKSVKTCKYGNALAPSVKASKNGAVLMAVTYDDPHDGMFVKPKGVALVSSFHSGDDGMAVGIAPTSKRGETGAFEAIGKMKRSGGGQAIGISISVRPERRLK